MHGSPSLKVRGKLLTCLPVSKQAEPDSLAVRIDLDQRAALLVEAPDIYYVTDHYIPYPMVLVRMSRISRDALRDLLKTGWRFVTDRKGKARDKSNLKGCETTHRSYVHSGLWQAGQRMNIFQSDVVCKTF